MKLLKTFEKFNKPYSELHVGDIYITDKVWISDFMLDSQDQKKYHNSHKKIFNIVKIISIDTEKINRRLMEPIKVKAFFKDDEKEYIFNLYKNNLIRKATTEEELKFNLIENSKKYNI